MKGVPLLTNIVHKKVGYIYKRVGLQGGASPYKTLLITPGHLLNFCFTRVLNFISVKFGRIISRLILQRCNYITKFVKKNG